ncbi:MAG: helix-turn-helix domain-containing protein [Oscillospiraceae bacterium]
MAKYNRIKDLREDNDKTQQEIADYLGTSSQHYGKYELGRAEIPFDRAIMLARYYNVSLDYIAGLTNNKKGISGAFPEDRQEIPKLIEKLSDEEKKDFAAILQAILDKLNNTNN